MSDDVRELGLADLFELVRSGAKITTDSPPQVVVQMDELVAAVKGLASNGEMRAEADLARSKTQLEVLAALQGLIRSGNVTKLQKIDLTPLKTILADIQENTAPSPRPVYTFDVIRSRQGFIERVVATPQPSEA